MTMGMLLPRVRSSVATASPGTSGSPRSRTTRSGMAESARLSASAPEPADRTVKPPRSRYDRTSSRSFRSSSTSKIVVATAGLLLPAGLARRSRTQGYVARAAPAPHHHHTSFTEHAAHEGALRQPQQLT